MPALSELNVYDGFVLDEGVGTSVTLKSVGAVVSITNVSRVSVSKLPAASVTVIVIVLYVSGARVSKVIVLFP